MRCLRPTARPRHTISSLCQPSLWLLFVPGSQRPHKQRAMTTPAATARPAQHGSILWLRRDLRLADNPALTAAAAQADALLPVYCIDPREYQPRQLVGHQALGIPKTGPWRTRFLLQALHALRRDLQSLGSDLVVRVGRPEDVLPQMVQSMAPAVSPQGSVSLHFSGGILSDSTSLEDTVIERVKNTAAALGVPCRVYTHWSSTLYHPDDLPYEEMAKSAGVRGKEWQGLSAELTQPHDPVQPHTCVNRRGSRLRHLPPVMTDFRKALAAGSVSVREPLPAPTALPPLPTFILDPAAPTVAAASPAACAGQGNTAATSAEQGSISAVHAGQGDIPTTARDVYTLTGTDSALSALSELLGTAEVPGADLPHDSAPDPRSAFQLQGGEAAALRRLRQYIWGREEGGDDTQPPEAAPALQYYTNTRSQAVGDLSSTKLSAYLALGCISPRAIWHEVERVRRAAEAAGLPQEAACSWLGMHLQIRDYYILTAIKAGESLMSERGIQGQPVEWLTDTHGAMQRCGLRWCRGMTGLPFVDACMRELSGSGWMSNRGRQNVASLLTKELRVDWRQGAAFFECLLLDHDLGVNYCNWNYFAGIGTDPRNRRFKTVTQGMQYDEDATLVRDWVPELASLPTQYRHAPWLMSAEERKAWGVQLGVTYPEPIVDPATQTGVLKAGDKDKAVQKKVKAVAAGMRKS